MFTADGLIIKRHNLAIEVDQHIVMVIIGLKGLVPGTQMVSSADLDPASQVGIKGRLPRTKPLFGTGFTIYRDIQPCKYGVFFDRIHLPGLVLKLQAGALNSLRQLKQLGRLAGPDRLGNY